MFCPYCGTKLPDGAAFCGSCGRPLTQQPAAEPKPAAADVPPAATAAPTTPAPAPTAPTPAPAAAPTTPAPAPAPAPQATAQPGSGALGLFEGLLPQNNTGEEPLLIYNEATGEVDHVSNFD